MWHVLLRAPFAARLPPPSLSTPFCTPSTPASARPPPQNAGHERGHGLADHHMLHYWVTGGTLLHLFYIRDAVTHQVHMHHPSFFAQQ